MRSIKGSQSLRIGTKLKFSVVATIIASCAACGGGTSDNNALDIGQALEETEAPDSDLLAGVFFDSPVTNIGFRTSSGEGKTNENGEFYYLQGEQITFTIGDIELPAITAKDIITPLDIFRTSIVKNTEVINLARLLQTLDTDNNPENGIRLPDSIELISADVGVAFYNSDTFDDVASNALQQAGIDATMVDSGIAATHLSNSLLARGLVEVSQIDPSLALVDLQPNRQLADLDTDSVADIFDLDIDGDEVVNLLDQFPEDATEHRDSDEDGIGDNTDTDDDNDGTPDQFDYYPFDPIEQLDSDNDGIGNNTDDDDDNDGTLDLEDHFPIDPTEQTDADNDGIGNNADNDDDNDGVLDIKDQFPFKHSEQLDTDNDGIGNNADDDDDNDGVADYFDIFPFDPTEQYDNDFDGFGNNSDNDDDNDGTLDSDDRFPFNPTEQLDADKDGLGDNIDHDDDNDGTPDDKDQYPTDPTEQIDTDNDGIGDNADNDDDNDGTLDSDDALPLDPTESSDIDNDGIGDNTDDDNDNDGTINILDVFPLNPDETADSDEDGIGDNADLDDDNDQVPDTEDAFPFDASESADSDNDGLGDNVDFDRDNDGVDDVDDAFPDDPKEQYDHDSDGYGDNEDPDDDNDGVWDTDDALPKDSTESADIDRDGIGNNADDDDDNDGVLDADDLYPLNRSCSTAEHSASDFCDPQFTANVAFIENIGETAFLFNRYSPIAQRVVMSTGEALAPIDFSSFANPGDIITAVKYHSNHDRLYVALSSGVIVFITADNDEATYYYTAPERINGLAAIEHLLLASQYIYGEDYTTNVLKESGFLLHTNLWSLADLNESAWNSTEGHIYILESYNGLERRSINLETGNIGPDTHGTYYLTPGVFIKAPFAFSPDDSQLVSADGKIYYSDQQALIEESVISTENFSDLMWTTEGLITTRTTNFATTVEYYNDTLTLQDSQLLPGDPMELLYDQGTFYIVSGNPVIGLLFNAYVPSDQGAIERNTIAPEPFIDDITSDTSTIDSNGDGVVDSTDIEYTSFKNAAQGKWETPCSAVPESNGTMYALHGIYISDPEVLSALTFYNDSECQTYFSSYLINSHALHRSITSYGNIITSVSGLPTTELTFDTTDLLNSAPFPIHFPRNQIFTIEESILYFGAVGLTNIESLKLDIDRPFHKVESFTHEGLFETIEQKIVTGYSTSSDPDRDGIVNAYDEFPNDPYEFIDLDNDGIGDNADPDDDNDGIPDLEDPDPFNP